MLASKRYKTRGCRWGHEANARYPGSCGPGHSRGVEKQLSRADTESPGLPDTGDRSIMTRGDTPIAVRIIVVDVEEVIVDEGGAGQPQRRGGDGSLMRRQAVYVTPILR